MTAPSPKPACKILLAGVDITAKIAPRLVSLTLTEDRDNEADQLDLVLDDADGKLAIPKRGAELVVSLGWEGSPLVGKGKFKVDEVEHSGPPDVVTLRARSADFTADLRLRREKSWTDTTVGAVLQEIAARHGLTARISDGLANQALPVLAQSRESDLQVLKKLGRRFDAVATIKAGALLFSPIGAAKTPSGKALAKFALTRQDGDTHTWRAADRDSAFTGVTASWRSTTGATRHSERSGQAGKVHHLRQVYATQADAKRAAASAWSRIGRTTGLLSMNLALGRPDLFPECEGSITGFGKPEIDKATWLVAKATHSYSDRGLVTALELETSSSSTGRNTAAG
ncbi:MAG: phage late control D family protein [Caulobacter sp.]|nr:phage late control D family protein [Caulobacter sp.]